MQLPTATATVSVHARVAAWPRRAFSVSSLKGICIPLAGSICRAEYGFFAELIRGSPSLVPRWKSAPPACLRNARVNARNERNALLVTASVVGCRAITVENSRGARRAREAFTSGATRGRETEGKDANWESMRSVVERSRLGGFNDNPSNGCAFNLSDTISHCQQRDLKDFLLKQWSRQAACISARGETAECFAACVC